VKREAKFGTQLKCLYVVVTNSRGSGIQSEKVLYIMTEEINTMLRCQHPLDHVCESSEDVRCKLKTKRASHPHIMFFRPLYTQQLAIQKLIAMLQ